MAKAKKPTTSDKVATKRPAVITPRRLKKPAYKSFHLSRSIKGDRLPSAFRLFKDCLGMLARNWKVFLCIVLIYGLLNALLVQGFSAFGDIEQAKQKLDALFTGSWGQLTSSFTIFLYLLGTSGNTANPTAGAYQLMLVLVVSLAIIWTLHQLYAGHKLRARDGFYLGMSPLVKFILVLLVVVVQLIPLAIGILLYATVTANGIAATAIEHILWAVLAFVLLVLSLYMISSSLFALYIVTLPDMTPMRALRSARQLVANRRWAVLRKLVFLPIAICVMTAVIVVPVILFATPLAAWVFFALTMILLPVVHGYLYALYRSMV